MEKLKIGKIVGTHGLRGELKIRSNSDFEDQRFVPGSILIVQNTEFEVKTVRVHKGNYLISFKDKQDINLVEKYVGSDVYGYKDDVELEEGEFFYEDLIGCQIIDGEKVIGKVTEIMDNGIQDILVVKTGDKNIMIPYVDAFIEEEDIENKVIYVHLIKGFFDED